MKLKETPAESLELSKHRSLHLHTRKHEQNQLLVKLTITCMLPCSGYMSPEYIMHGQISVKTDVFSFGVLVLEIMSGRKHNAIIHDGELEDLLTYVSIWMW